MALPKIGIQYYDLDLISGKRVQYRPFTVKEEKILLVANESKDQKQISNALRTVLNNCLVQEEGEERVVVEDLPMFDVEHLFLHIRMKSVGETSDFNVTCEECEGSPQVKTTLDLRNVKIENEDRGEPERIMLNSDVGIEIQYPPFRALLERSKGSKSPDENPLMAIEMISDCINKIFDSKETYTRKDFSRKEIDDFVDSLSQVHLKKINEFFERMPRLTYDLKVECPCGKVIERKLQGINDFFS